MLYIRQTYEHFKIIDIKLTVRRENLQCISNYCGIYIDQNTFQIVALLITRIFTMQVSVYNCNTQNIASKELTTAVVRLSTT